MIELCLNFCTDYPDYTLVSPPTGNVEYYGYSHHLLDGIRDVR